MLSDSFKWASLQTRSGASDRDILSSFSFFLQFTGDLTGGREGALCMLAQERGVRSSLICMVEMHCKKSKYVQGINIVRVGELEIY